MRPHSNAQSEKSPLKHVIDFLAHAAGHGATYLLLSVLAPIASTYLLKHSFVAIPIWVIALIFSVSLAIPLLAAWILHNQKVKLLPAFDAASFAKAARTAREIFILNTFVPNLQEIHETLESALENGVHIKILMLRPNCQEIDYRASSLGLSPTVLNSDIEKACDYLAQKLVQGVTKNNSLLEIGFHTSWIPFSFYGSDKIAIVGFFFFDVLAVKGPSLLISRRHPLSNLFWAQFERLWNLPNLTIVRAQNWRHDLDNTHRKIHHEN